MSDTNSPKLRVAVVGGGIGKAHLHAFKSLSEQFEVLAICDIDADKARTIAEVFAIPHAVTDFDELCRRDDLDIIDICTPPHLHFKQAEQVLQSGKHAICEKPLVGSLRDVDTLKRIETESGKRLMPIFQYRFGRGLQKLKYLAACGLLGQAYVATSETMWRRRASYYDVPWRGKWQTELGGSLLGHAIHAHDMLYYVMGPIQNVYTRMATRVNPIEVEDCASVSLQMRDGSLASLTVTLGSVVEMTRHRFCFNNLVAESTNTLPYNNSAEPWSFVGDTPELVVQIEEALAQFVPEPESFEGQFARYYRALMTGSELPVTLDDARASLELITAMYHSAEHNLAVELPIGPDHPKYTSWIPDLKKSSE